MLNVSMRDVSCGTHMAGTPSASYNIILTGTDSATGVDYAVEYDCAENALFGLNYW